MSKFEKTNQYNATNYYTITLRLPKDKKDVMETLAKVHDRSINNLIIRALEQTYGISLRK